MSKETLQGKEVKISTMTDVTIHDKEINAFYSIVIDIKNDICIGKLMCYDVDQIVNDDIFTKIELQNLLGKKFDIKVEDNDCENTHNSMILIKSCYMYKYSHFIIAGKIRVIQYEFSFSKENKQELIKP